MTVLVSILRGVIERGCLFALVVTAVYLTSRIIKFDDLSVEGSFGLGGAVAALCAMQGLSFVISLPLALLGGCLAGLSTGLIHVTLKLNNLIIAGDNTIFSITSEKLIILLPVSISIILIIRWLLQTEIGFMLRAVGENPAMLTTLGKSISGYKIACLMLANGITAFAGALFVNYVGYFSIWANVGILILSLTGLILAELVSTRCGISILLGAIIYQAIIATTFEFNIDQDWNKLIAATILIGLLTLRQRQQSSARVSL